MAPITASVEINRRPEDVFAYLDDLSRHGEWQESIASVEVLTDGPTHVGSRAKEQRRMGKREVTATYEVIERDPPRVFGFRGIDGPVRVKGQGTLEPLDDGTRTRLTLELDFTGHGIGLLFAPLAKGQARKQVPVDQAKLKEKLESGAA